MRPLPISLVVSVLLLVPDLIAAEYGPRTFVRQPGAPRTVVETFERRVAAERYDLVIASERAGAASVWLNGVAVAQPSDFSVNRGAIRRAVALREGPNEVAVEVAGAPGATVTVRISAVAGAGGATLATGGASFTIPPGALSGDTEVDLGAVAASDVGLTLPYPFLGAVRVDLEAPLSAKGMLSTAFAGAVQGRALVARVVSPRLELVDLAAQQDGVVGTIASPLAGVRGSGTFVFLDVPASLGILAMRLVGPDGAPATGTYVHALTESASAFTGFAGQDGLAAIPGMPPGDEVIVLAGTPGAATARVAVTAAPLVFLDAFRVRLPELPDIVADGFIPAWLHDFVIRSAEGIDPDSLPSAPPQCPCTVLYVQPTRIPLTGTFAPGNTTQLSVYCGSDDVTSSSFELPFLLQGLRTSFTSYGGYDPLVVSVSGGGQVTAQAPGRTRVRVDTATVQLYSTRDPVSGRRFVTPHQCWAQGGVDPVEVSCPPSAPHWNAALRRCDVHFGVSVSGSGTVSLAPALIPSCRSTCSAAAAPGQSVTATATADAGWVFTGWSGACSGSAATSPVTVQEGTVCTATFIVQNKQLSIAKAGSGVGTVTSSPAGLTCDENCPFASASFPAGSLVTLSAIPGSASTFAGWSGACSGTAPTTTVTMTADRSCTATFNGVLKSCHAFANLGTYHFTVPGFPSAQLSLTFWGESFQSRFGAFATTDLLVWWSDPASPGPSNRVGSPDFVWSPTPAPQSEWPLFWSRLRLVAARWRYAVGSGTVTFWNQTHGDYWVPSHVTVTVPSCTP